MATIIEASPVAKGPRLGLFNHTALRTRSPEQSRKFYSQLGLVEIAEFNFDTLTVWLLGGPDTATETLTLRTGLLEIVYPHRGRVTSLGCEIILLTFVRFYQRLSRE